MDAWKSDNYKLVGKSFEFSYANRINKLLEIVGTVTTNSIDYEIKGGGGYGEVPKYDGHNLNEAKKKRAFNTIVVPEEYELTEILGYKECKIDKSGECARVGKQLGSSMGMTVYLHLLRMFGNAFNPAFAGGDSKPWAATDHPNASLGSQGRKFVADPDSGSYSNLITTALSVNAITAAQAAGGRMLTPDGLPYAADYNLLLVSPELEATAKQICGDNGKLRPTGNPDTDTNAANPVADLQYMVIGGGADGFTKKQWAICDKSLMKDLVKLVYITKPMVKQTMLDNPWKDAYSTYADFGAGWGDARQIIFSNPA